MILRSFYIKLILRILALALVMLGSLYALIAAHRYIAASVSGVVAVINAIEALKDKKDHKEIRIRSFTEDGSLTLIFKDNGKGISRENIEKNFVPFYTTKKSGTGIGLSLARQITRLHRGSINVKSAPGEGTEFILKF